ncbi:MAG: hypothetical protein IJO63_03360 [Bacilli bacterium]|nr:hypothetical protein [Bacilli bacterium]
MTDFVDIIENENFHKYYNTGDTKMDIDFILNKMLLELDFADILLDFQKLADLDK